MLHKQAVTYKAQNESLSNTREQRVGFIRVKTKEPNDLGTTIPFTMEDYYEK